MRPVPRDDTAIPPMSHLLAGARINSSLLASIVFTTKRLHLKRTPEPSELPLSAGRTSARGQGAISDRG